MFVFVEVVVCLRLRKNCENKGTSRDKCNFFYQDKKTYDFMTLFNETFSLLFPHPLKGRPVHLYTYFYTRQIFDRP